LESKSVFVESEPNSTLIYSFNLKSRCQARKEEFHLVEISAITRK